MPPGKPLCPGDVGLVAGDVPAASFDICLEGQHLVAAADVDEDHMAGSAAAALYKKVPVVPHMTVHD
jgi:hypothetical protein